VAGLGATRNERLAKDDHRRDNGKSILQHRSKPRGILANVTEWTISAAEFCVDHRNAATAAAPVPTFAVHGPSTLATCAHGICHQRLAWCAGIHDDAHNASFTMGIHFNNIKRD
jgi:hypothetical protein